MSTANGSVSSSSSFDVTSGAIPVINGFLPSSGAVGATVHVYGANFTGASAVRFNGHAATPFTIIGPGNIQTTVPAGATSGRITVTTPAGTGTSATDFTVTAGPIPVINSFLPSSGAVGATVHVYGANFTGATAVRFNGHAATPFTIIGPGNIQTTVPVGATSGRITVTTPAGTGTSASNFTVTGGGLTITSFSPTSGSVGTAVTINGTGFTNVSAVRFNGTGATFTVASATRINTTVPAGATTGKISVTTPAGTVTSAGTFTVVGPKINSLSPNSGPVGTSVAIFGTSFTGVTSVRFNGVSATFTPINATQVNATVPGGSTTGRVTLDHARRHGHESRELHCDRRCASTLGLVVPGPSREPGAALRERKRLGERRIYRMPAQRARRHQALPSRRVAVGRDDIHRRERQLPDIDREQSRALSGQGAQGHAGERRGLRRKAFERGAPPSLGGEALHEPLGCEIERHA